MKERMQSLIRETELSKIVDKQEAKLRKREKQLKARRLKLQKELHSSDLTKVPMKKSNNFATREMIIKNFPDFQKENIDFYIDVMCDFLRVQLGVVTKDIMQRARFEEELKRADMIAKRLK